MTKDEGQEEEGVEGVKEIKSNVGVSLPLSLSLSFFFFHLSFS